MINQDRTVSFLEGKALLFDGWLKPDMIGKSIFTLLEQGVENQIASYIEQAFAGEEASFELLVNERYFSFNVLPIFYSGPGKVENLLGIVLDSTERKKLHDQRIELENLKLEQEMERHKIMTASLISGMDKERIRIAQELHDGIGQNLNVIKLKADTIKA
jgi:signal transduction histidine kinase